MWSVVHLPSVLIRSGISVRSFPSHGANGASFWSRLLSGAITTSTLAFSSLGAMNPLSSTANPLGGKVKPVGASSITLLPSLSSKDDYNKVQENDRISLTGLKEFAPGSKLTVTLKHKDGSVDSFEVEHTYNDTQIAWFKAGSALNFAAKK
jgi:hypothetical protein